MSRDEQEAMTCEQAAAALGEGARPAERPALAAHLGSCLECYRLAADLREFPALAAKLLQQRDRDGAGAAASDLFFARFPARVADAWERRRDEAAARAVGAATDGRGWRWPLFAATACAAAIALATTSWRQPHTAGDEARDEGPAPAAVAESGGAAAAGSWLDEPFVVEAPEEVVAALDGADLDEVAAWFPLDPAWSEDAPDDEPRAGSLGEEIELMAPAELEALASALVGVGG